MAAVQEVFYVSAPAIVSSARYVELVEARMALVAYARSQNVTVQQIGAYLGRDHSTICNAYQKHQSWISAKTDDLRQRDYQERYAVLCDVLDGPKTQSVDLRAFCASARRLNMHPLHFSLIKTCAEERGLLP